MPRFTGDLDLLIRRNPENAGKVCDALRDFGFASQGITREDLLTERRVIQLGVRPNRTRVPGDLDGVPVS